MSDISVWNKTNLSEIGKNRHFPSEILMRSIFSNSYFDNCGVGSTSGRVLDVGCLYSNNLVPFFDRGWSCFGVEVTDESVAIAEKSAEGWGIEADIRRGLNTQLSFEAQYFDLVLSMSTIHYEETLEDVRAALIEFRRVLRPGGFCLIQTVAPAASIYSNSERTNEGNFRLNNDKDIRHGQSFYFFETSEELRNTLTEVFDWVQIARSTDTFPSQTVDVWIALCRV